MLQATVGSLEEEVDNGTGDHSPAPNSTGTSQLRSLGHRLP